MSIKTNTDRPAQCSRARQRAWHAARIDTLLTLRQRFPHAFARLSDSARRPLKIGIHLDIHAAAPDFNRGEVSRALRFYVSDICYQRACIEGAERIGLDGKPAGTVTAADAESSKRSIAGIEAKVAQRQARRAITERANPAPKPISEKPKRLTLAGLKAAVAQRKLSAQGA